MARPFSFYLLKTLLEPSPADKSSHYTNHLAIRSYPKKLHKIAEPVQESLKLL